jgi:hypothetical protein
MGRQSLFSIIRQLRRWQKKEKEKKRKRKEKEEKVDEI